MATRRDFEQTSFLYGGNSSFLEDLYARYLIEPASVEASWRAYFDDFGPENRALFERANEGVAIAEMAEAVAQVDLAEAERQGRVRRQRGVASALPTPRAIEQHVGGAERCAPMASVFEHARLAGRPQERRQA